MGVFSVVIGLSLVVMGLFNKHSWAYILLGLAVSYGLYAYEEFLYYLIFLFGVGFLVLEFYIPDFGLFGIIGVGSLLYSFVQVVGWNIQLLYLILAVLMVVIGTFYLNISSGKKLELGKGLALDKTINSKDEAGNIYIGSDAVVMTDLRPTGKVEVEGQLVDAVSNGVYIAKGTVVSVVNYKNGQVYVQVK